MSNEHLSTVSNEREVRYEFSAELAQFLTKINASVLISTYQAGKLAVVGSLGRELKISFHNFDRPMGIALHQQNLEMAVAARDKVWLLRNAQDIAPQLTPQRDHSDCFLTRSAHVTGEIQAHEMAWVDSELWIVNTSFSCLCTLDANYSFVPRWRPRFISELAAEDRCHLNGLAVDREGPKYVTAMAETNTAGGWRPEKDKTGCLMHVETGTTVARGFAMPHSPRIHMGFVWLLDSGNGSLVCVEPTSGRFKTVARFPGFTRGLAFHGKYAFVGLSKIRESSTFEGVPIAENRERLKSGFAVVDLESTALVAQFEFKTGVEEIFDVALVHGTGQVAMRGPFAQDDGEQTVWVVPRH